MNKKKVSLTQVIRHIIQLGSFIIIPALFILAFNSVKSIYLAILDKTFSFSSQSSSILTLIAIIPVTMFSGRFFCGYLCAFGSMQELISSIAKILHIPQIKYNSVVDNILKVLKFIVLAAIFVAWTKKFDLDKYNPWNVFGVYSSYKGWTTVSNLLTIGGGILLLIIILSLFTERVFCRYFCPLGAIFTLLSLIRIFKVKKAGKLCSDCSVCNHTCPMHIDIKKDSSSDSTVHSGECINCFRCVEGCASSSLETASSNAVTGCLAAVAIAGIYLTGTMNIDGKSAIPDSDQELNEDDNAATDGSTSENAQNDSEQGTDDSSDASSMASILNSSNFKDGVYTGTGTGFRGDVDVTVTVSDGKISDIVVDYYEDDDHFFESAESSVISDIIDTQSTDVSTVSGATFSSNGIIEAVADALDIEFTNPNESMKREGRGHRH